jgi:hypothetical protein
VDETSLARIRQLATLVRLFGSSPPAGALRLFGVICPQILWNICIGHAENKKKAAVALPALTKQLAKMDAENFSVVESLMHFSLMAIWSICYGIIENKKQVVESDGANLICKLLMKPEANFDIRYAASGAIWHISEFTVRD